MRRVEREEGAVAPDAGRARCPRPARFRQARNRPGARARPRGRGGRATRGLGPCSSATMRSGWSGPRITASPLSRLKRDAALLALAFALHLDRAEGGRLDVDLELLDRGDEHVAAVGLAPQDGREQPHHRRPADRLRPRDTRCRRGRCACPNGRSARVPLVDRRQAALRRSAPAARLRLDALEARSVGGSRASAVAVMCERRSNPACDADCSLGHATGDDRAAEPRSSPAPASASARRSPRRCSPMAGRVVAHVRRDGDAVPDGRGQGRRRPCRCRIAPKRSSPPRRGCRRCGCWSTMRRASRGTDSATFDAERIRRAHGGQRARAAAADRGASRRRTTAAATRWSSTCSTPSSPRRTPISSATPCPSRRWPALTELAARALAPQGHPGQWRSRRR